VRRTLEIVLGGVILAAGCAHGSQSEIELPADPAKALATARSTIGQQCQGDGAPTEACCAALLAAGDALLADGKKEEAIAAYERTRDRCPLLHDSRRRLFLVHTPPVRMDPAPAETTISWNVGLNSQTADDIHLAWYGAYLDGTHVPPMIKRSTVTSGPHVMAVELFFEPRMPGGLGGLTRFEVKQPLLLSRETAQRSDLIGGVNVRVTDRGGDGTIADRLKVEIQPRTFGTMEDVIAQPAQSSKPAPTSRVMLAPDIGKRQQITPADDGLSDEVKNATFLAFFKICVTREGSVDVVNTMMTSNPAVIGDLTAAIWHWRFRPYQVNGQPVAFCTITRLSGRS
jgi:hypothetical protein